MSKDKKAYIITANSPASMLEQEDERPAFVKKIGKTTYRVQIHFSTTIREIMSDKIKRMLRNEINRM